MRNLLIFAALFASPAAAQEVTLGAFHRPTEMPWNNDLSTLETGTDIQASYRHKSEGWEPQATAHIALHNGASMFAVGIGRKVNLDRFYLRPAIGIAVHTGPDIRWQDGRRTDYGSRVLFTPEMSIGYRFDGFSVEASWFHASHAELFSPQNPGHDSFGLRVVKKLGGD